MKAAVYHRRGPARDVLEIVDLPVPAPGPGEVRVRVRVSGVNPTDWKSRSAGPDLPAEGQIPDQDGAGEIDAVGPGVDPGRVGERVWVYNAAHGRFNGTAAQYTVVPSAQAVMLPDGIGFDVGAGLGIPFVTAQHCVFADGPVAGRTVLVTGGAGAVGNAAVQLAKRGGARVIATISSEEKARLAAHAGADHVLDYRAPDYVAQVRRIAPDGVDRIVDVAIAANLSDDIDVLVGHGTIVSYATDAPDPAIPVRRLMTANAHLEFVLVYNLTREQREAAVNAVSEALRVGGVRPMPEHHFPLDRIADAHEAVERHALGKVLVDIP